MQSFLEPWYARRQIQGYEKSNIDEIIINSKRLDDAVTFQKGLRNIFLYLFCWSIFKENNFL